MHQAGQSETRLGGHRTYYQLFSSEIVIVDKIVQQHIGS